MKTLDELFNKAQSRKSPLTKSEVRDIVSNVTLVKPVKTTVLKAITLYTIPIVACIALIVLLQKLTLATKEKPAALTNASFEKLPEATAGNEAVVVPLLAEKTTEDLSEPKSPISGGSNSFKTNKTVSSIETNKNGDQITFTDGNELETKNITDVIDTILKPLVQKNEDIQTDVTEDELPQEQTSLAPKIDTGAKKSVIRPKHPYKSRHFIRTDVLGFFYNGVAQQLFFKTNHINPSPLSGNKISFGYENLFHPKFSLGATFSYGFSPVTVSKERVHNDSVVVEKFENYKGIMASIDARYYFTHNSGQGLYVGASLGYGYLQERAFANNFLYYPSLNATTIITTKGHSFGFGLLAGYKIQIGRFYLEPNFSYTIFGGSSSYFDRGGTKKEERIRYKALNRYEINFGYRL